MALALGIFASIESAVAEYLRTEGIRPRASMHVASEAGSAPQGHRLTSGEGLSVAHQAVEAVRQVRDGYGLARVRLHLFWRAHSAWRYCWNRNSIRFHLACFTITIRAQCTTLLIESCLVVFGRSIFRNVILGKQMVTVNEWRMARPAAIQIFASVESTGGKGAKIPVADIDSRR